MTLETISIPLYKGIHNKSRPESIPEGYCREAVNVDFNRSGHISQRPGQTLIYSGNCHSLWNNYFVEDGTLKRLNPDYSAAIIKEDIGDAPVSYCTIAGRIYFTNGLTLGSVVNGVYQSWGVPRPARQPDVTEQSGGGLHAGTYQVAITWMRKGEESGTIGARSITISEGAGLVLSNFPTPPYDVDQIGVYVSSVNGTELYLYKEVPSFTSSLSVEAHISNIPLTTQFASPPRSFTIIEAHYGRVYGVAENRVYFSEPQNYGLFRPNQYWTFSDEVRCLVSVPGALYVGTAGAIYKISGIDSGETVQRLEVRDYGAARILNTAYDPEKPIGYITSARGYCAVSTDGVQDLTHEHFAMSEFGNSVLSVVEQNGIRKLIGINRNVLKESPLKVI